jgi:hypothetical protein
MSRPVGRNTGELVPNDSTRYYVTMSLEQAVEPTGSCMVGLSGLHSMHASHAPTTPGSCDKRAILATTAINC